MEIEKKSELVEKIKAVIDQDFAEGRTTTYSDSELENIIKDIDSDAYLALIHHRKQVISKK